MRVVRFGATGMVGQGVLRECLRDEGVEAVLAIGRSSTGLTHPGSTTYSRQCTGTADGRRPESCRSSSCPSYRPFLYPEDDSVRVKPADRLRFVIFTFPFGQYYAAPVDVLVTERCVRAFPGGTGDVKAAGNYAGALLADQEALGRRI